MGYRARRTRDEAGRPVCRWCGEQLRFARVEIRDGYYCKVPLEGPSELNGVYIIQRGVARRLSTISARQARDEGYDLYVYHDCPSAPKRYKRHLAER